MEDIPAPAVLDPDRVSRDDREDMTAEDHRTQSKLLDKALSETCAYAQHLWNDLAAMRQYLHDSLPAEPGANEPVGASPSGPDDAEGWQRWTDAYAEITSVLCGPHGDSGFGRSTANQLAQSRRIVTVPTAGRHATDDDLAALTRTESDADAVDTVARHARPQDDEAAPAEATPAASAGRRLLEPLGYGAIGAVLSAVALRKRARPRS